jgi:hypothetical protein
MVVGAVSRFSATTYAKPFRADAGIRPCDFWRDNHIPAISGGATPPLRFRVRDASVFLFMILLFYVKHYLILPIVPGGARNRVAGVRWVKPFGNWHM